MSSTNVGLRGTSSKNDEVYKGVLCTANWRYTTPPWCTLEAPNYWHALRRTHRRDACTCATNVFSTFLLPGQPCMSWLDMHPQVQRAKFCNKFSRFSPSSAFGRASIALRRPAKAKPVSCWSKLAANVSSRCFQRCWFACGKDNTNASYSGMTALHPGPRRCAPRAGIRRSCPHTRVVLERLGESGARVRIATRDWLLFLGLLCG